jgi:hypothetical protein
MLLYGTINEEASRFQAILMRCECTTPSRNLGKTQSRATAQPKRGEQIHSMWCVFL